MGLSMDIDLRTHNHQFRAMGSQIQLWLDCPDPDAAAQAFAPVQAYFDEVEAALSRFQPDSELSRLNRRTGQWVTISLLLWDVLLKALALAELSDGLYDPTLLAALEAAGYVDSFEMLAQGVHAPLATQHLPPGQWREVQLDPERRAVWLPPGARLGLDGVIKGYTAERAAQRLSLWGPCLVDAGGDLVAGAAPVGSGGWPVAIAAPGSAETENLLTLSLAEAALATSGIDYRRWQVNGHAAHHIIDSRTGQPAATDLLTVSVLLKRAVQAEAVATAVMVLGQDAGFEWLAEREIPALLVSQTGTMHVTPAMEAACYDQLFFE